MMIDERIEITSEHLEHIGKLSNGMEVWKHHTTYICGYQEAIAFDAVGLTTVTITNFIMGREGNNWHSKEIMLKALEECLKLNTLASTSKAMEGLTRLPDSQIW